MVPITDQQLLDNLAIAREITEHEKMPEPVSEEEANENILEIYNIIKKQPESFVMSNWHSLILKAFLWDCPLSSWMGRSFIRARKYQENN